MKVPRGARASLLLCVLTFVPLAVAAQPVPRMPRIGVLLRGMPGPSPNVEALRQGMRELGYVDGQNIIFEYRYDEGTEERLRAAAADLVRARVDVIVTWGSQAIHAAQAATREIPIVIAYTSDPLESGWVASLARPGGNVTGLSAMGTELTSKRLELLKEIVPGASRVAALFHRADQASVAQVTAMQPVARSLGVTLRAWDVNRADELPTTFAAMAVARTDALVVVHGAFVLQQERQILDLTAKHRLPAIYHLRRWADTGGLVAYGPSQTDMSRQAARYVDRILKGAKAGDLPVEEPAKFELIVNLKTAKALGLTMPPSVLGRADEVIR
jgi:putative tryptophan/tyrosine transport system substrate-binding protein